MELTTTAMARVWLGGIRLWTHIQFAVVFREADLQD